MAWFDESRDTARTCQRLHIQRATLYYRLANVKSVAGAGSFDDGWALTAAHVALRGWWLRQQLAELGDASHPR